MALAQFKIEDKREETRQTKKPIAFAGVHFSVKVDGKEVALPYKTHVWQDYLRISVGCAHSQVFSVNSLFLPRFGTTMAQTLEESDRLVSWKSTLEAGIVQLAQKLTVNTAQLPLTKKDPFTGNQVVIMPEVIKHDVVVEYAFIEPTFEIVDEKVQIPSRLFFNCVAPPPKEEIVGKAGDLCVRFSKGSKGLRATMFSFGETGWISDYVDMVRAKFSDAIIEAAFKDLACKWIALDTTPKDAIAWTGVTKTSFTLQ